MHSKYSFYNGTSSGAGEQKRCICRYMLLVIFVDVNGTEVELRHQESSTRGSFFTIYFGLVECPCIATCFLWLFFVHFLLNNLIKNGIYILFDSSM
jgi:hypothetical protein